MTDGTMLSHYRLLRKLGQGGMGEVYLAEDTRLKRQVAIKVVSESLRHDPERLRRFRREAEAAAQLNHPNIATIYALEEVEGVLFIVMEYVEGVTLAAHLLHLPDGMALDAFFATFLPLADALAHAHEHGRVHRDLKPGNIMLAKDGTPKILDFGLARITRPDPDPAPPSPQELDSQAPTITDQPPAHAPPSLTQGPVLLGTPAYMSPEQAERKVVDARTDVFSFGVVLYEALTGQRPFKGDSLESLIGRILTQEPEPVTTLRPMTPYLLWHVIRQCLVKARDRRMQTARELHTELQVVQQDIQAGTVLVDTKTMPASSKPEPRPLWRQPAAIIAMIVLFGAVTALTVWLLKPVSEPPLRKFALTVEPFGSEFYNGPAISPNGTMIAYSQHGRLWIRELTTLTPRELPETDGAQRPFWSSNNDFVAYFTLNPLTLRKVAVAGGPSLPLCDLPASNPRGGVWRPDGTIVFGVAGTQDFDRHGTLYTVPAAGGEPAVFAIADSSLDQRGLIYPALLPDGSLLYAATVGQETGALIVQRGEDRRVIFPNRRERVAFPVYSPTGHLLFQRGFPNSQGVWAVAFDVSALEVRGEPFPVEASGGYPTGSTDGTLVYRSVATTNALPNRLVWVDRQGRVEPMGEAQEGLSAPSLSPDGRLVAFHAASQNNSDIWVYDLGRDTTRRLTFDPAIDQNPVWSPDGRWVAFMSFRSRDGDIYVTAADGSGSDALLVGGPGADFPRSWSRDGRHLIYVNVSDSTRADLWSAPFRLNGGVRLDGPPQLVLGTPFSESVGRLSPDGRYLAYTSNESGRNEVYVRPFPGGEGRWQVLSDGGSFPRWSPKGDALYYVTSGTRDGAGAMMAAAVKTVGGFQVDRPMKLFDLPAGVNLSLFDVSPDGQRFLAVQAAGDAGGQAQTTITVVENWAREFAKKP